MNPRYTATIQTSQPIISLLRVCFSESRCHLLFACTAQPRLSSHPPTAGLTEDPSAHVFCERGSGSLEKAGLDTCSPIVQPSITGYQDRNAVEDVRGNHEGHARMQADETRQAGQTHIVTTKKPAAWIHLRCMVLHFRGQV
jgi:hypothetical protein